MPGGGEDLNKKAEAAAADAARTASDAASSVADAFKDLRLGERFKGVVRAYNELEEEGTPLRPYIRSARESINGAAVAVKVRLGRAVVVLVSERVWGGGQAPWPYALPREARSSAQSILDLDSVPVPLTNSRSGSRPRTGWAPPWSRSVWWRAGWRFGSPPTGRCGG